MEENREQKIMQFSLGRWRNSKSIRVVSFLILINFLISQTAFAQEEFQVQEGTHLYTPVKEVSAERLETGGHPEEPFVRHSERSEESRTQGKLRDEGSQTGSFGTTGAAHRAAVLSPWAAPVV